MKDQKKRVRGHGQERKGNELDANVVRAREELFAHVALDVVLQLERGAPPTLSPFTRVGASELVMQVARV